MPLRGHSKWASCVCFGNKTRGLLVSGSYDKTIKIWGLGKGTQATLRRTLEGHTDCVSRITLSPDDRYIASGSDDKTVGLWDVATGQRIRVLEGHEGDVYSVAWSHDGQFIVSGSSDGKVRVWEADVQVRMHMFGCECMYKHVGMVMSVRLCMYARSMYVRQ